MGALAAGPRIAVVGVSAGPICGARDHALLLAQALEHAGTPCSMHWLVREASSLAAERAEIRAWARELPAQLRREGADAVLLHYSVFAYAHRGVPLFVAPVLAALRRAGLPAIALLHELVYPWRHGGLRGKVWSVTQRAQLIGVVRDAAAVLLTTDFRARWVRTRPWLPRRALGVAPVFSNLPAPRAPQRPVRGRVGLFGYSFEGAAVGLVLDAIARARARGAPVELVLLGAPGPRSAVAAEWSGAARARGVEAALGFSGTLPAHELADALAACEVLLFADAAGPSERKGTLAASLAAGRAVLAIDGPRRWEELVAARAACVVEPTAGALADGLCALLADERRLEALGARGRRFAAERMSVERAAGEVHRLLAALDGLPPGEFALDQRGADSQLERAAR
jgi:glycosyltransferase involved in cell wall biosynthesis